MRTKYLDLAPIGDLGGQACEPRIVGIQQGQAAPFLHHHAIGSASLDVQAPPWILTAHPRSGRLIVSVVGRVISSTSPLQHLLRTGLLLIRDTQLHAIDPRNRTILGLFLVEACASLVWVDALLSPNIGHPPTILIRGRSAGPEGKIDIVVRDLSRDVTDIPDLTSLFDLTKSEFQIIALLLNGRSITDIAHVLNNSVLTVRTHLKRSYAKMGINSKEQLFAALLRLMAE